MSLRRRIQYQSLFAYFGLSISHCQIFYLINLTPNIYVFVPPRWRTLPVRELVGWVIGRNICSVRWATRDRSQPGVVQIATRGPFAFGKPNCNPSKIGNEITLHHVPAQVSASNKASVLIPCNCKKACDMRSYRCLESDLNIPSTTLC